MKNEAKIILQQKFGANLKQLRQSKGLSLRQLSANCSIDNSKISKIEKGKFDVYLTTILDLARGLEEAPSRLLEDSSAWIKQA